MPKVPRQNIRITGAGVPWEFREAERDMVRSLITSLEDNRLLFADLDIIDDHYFWHAIIPIRHALTKTLQDIGETSGAVPHLKAMRAACRKCVDKLSVPGFEVPDEDARKRTLRGVAIGELRSTIGLHLAFLCVAYNIDLEEHLATILPHTDDSEDDRQPPNP